MKLRKDRIAKIQEFLSIGIGIKESTEDTVLKQKITPISESDYFC